MSKSKYNPEIVCNGVINKNVQSATRFQEISEADRAKAQEDYESVIEDALDDIFTEDLTDE